MCFPGLLLAPGSSIAQQLANASPWRQRFTSNYHRQASRTIFSLDYQVFHKVFLLFTGKVGFQLKKICSRSPYLRFPKNWPYSRCPNSNLKHLGPKKLGRGQHTWPCTNQKTPPSPVSSNILRLCTSIILHVYTTIQNWLNLSIVHNMVTSHYRHQQSVSHQGDRGGSRKQLQHLDGSWPSCRVKVLVRAIGNRPNSWSSSWKPCEVPPRGQVEADLRGRIMGWKFAHIMILWQT